VISLEEGRRHRVADILEMGDSGVTKPGGNTEVWSLVGDQETMREAGSATAALFDPRGAVFLFVRIKSMTTYPGQEIDPHSTVYGNTEKLKMSRPFWMLTGNNLWI
jgi:hypothetical protein